MVELQVTVLLLGRRLQGVPPARAGQWNQHPRGSVRGRGRGQAPAGAHTAPLQGQSFLFPGEVPQHAGVVQLHLLQGVSEERPRRGQS